jgi:queuine tRNA-ribosyltransferase
MAGEMTAAVLMTLHNLAFYLDTLRVIRETIALGRFEEFRRELLHAQQREPGEDAESPPQP